MSDAAVDPPASPSRLPWHRPGLLVGVDGSPDSVEALRLAVAIAPKLDLPVHALVVSDPLSDLHDDYVAGVASPSPQDEAKQILAGVRKRVFPTGEPRWFTVGTERGRPAFVLLGHTAECSMLVLGRRGRSGLLGLVLGSVSAACIPRAMCPVLLAHHA